MNRRPNPEIGNIKISQFATGAGCGWTWTVSDGAATLGYFKSRNAARRKRIQVLRERRLKRSRFSSLSSALISPAK